MQKNFILDTNVLLHDPRSIYKFEDNHILIPIEVIEELDNFKRDLSDLGSNARRVVKDLDALRREGELRVGVSLDEGGSVRVVTGRFEEELRGSGLDSGRSTANRILGLALHLRKTEPDHPTVLVTKSINLRLKADALGIYTEDYEEPDFQDDETFLGYSEIEVDIDTIEAFKGEGTHTFEDRQFKPNECILMRDEGGSKAFALGRIVGREGTNLIPAHHHGEGVLGIEPLNLAQSFALEVLLNDDIKLVSLMGRAGTGKTLLAVAAGLYKVLEEDKYHKLLVSRPTMPMGRDIGFIPGDIEEKLRPWMKPIYDAVELLQDIDRRSRKRRIPADVLDSKEIDIEPLTYIRGRSIPNQYMVIDEAQNLTPLEVKTIITRVGHGTKIILTGDPEQIDDPYMDRMSNGFAHVSKAFRGETIAAHITLSKGERSALAETAAALL